NTVHYVYGAGGLLYGEYDNAGDLIREYVYLNGAPLAQVDAGAPETVIYLHADHLGTPRFATNTGGTQVWAWAGDAFGVGAPSGSATVNIRMPGQYVDAESGLFYNWNRYYNPAIGRYISSDPIGLEGGLNTFLYANASPVMYADPRGEVAIVDDIALIGFTGLALGTQAWLQSPAGQKARDDWTQWAQNTINAGAQWTQTNVVQPVKNWCKENFGDTNDPDDCEKLYQEIRSNVDLLKRRYYELLEDKLDLYNLKPTGAFSWQGHRQQFLQVQKTLRGLLGKAISQGCMSYQIDAWIWATRPAPSRPGGM
ncbi:MAG TPA: RHS repeat-associated core domain-containing protein, partial [Alphaproteobacteria bacterium]|nr:RHS repeat-associated core domain-containing protein [Alphaproteobacteria bacterium]